jgi:ubiquinone/menaquinone biosynthesis C-methylase UbiE
LTHHPGGGDSWASAERKLAPIQHFTDPTHLRSRQYRDSSNLEARVALHRRFTTAEEPWPRWYFDRLSIPPVAAVLDVGAGPGHLWAENQDRIPSAWEITLADFSPGMLEDSRSNLESVPHRFVFVVADVQDLPFPDGSFDAVLANHMLYHVPDRPRGLSEIRRVLRPGGRLYAATNGAAHLGRIRQIIHDVKEDVPSVRISGFSLESGAAELAPYFDRIELYRHESVLRVTDPETLKGYVRSMKEHYGLDDSELLAVERRIDEEMARDGVIEITPVAGVFEAQ